MTYSPWQKKVGGGLLLTGSKKRSESKRRLSLNTRSKSYKVLTALSIICVTRSLGKLGGGSIRERREEKEEGEKRRERRGRAVKKQRPEPRKGNGVDEKLSYLAPLFFTTGWFVCRRFSSLFASTLTPAQASKHTQDTDHGRVCCSSV